ncbi:hypothetical protein [Scandinavium goeteborgense]|uniref:Uncharacterized protein n=1 Tax=Scandinavium goeteborgense TaxID=1851514 RepID=A0A4V3BM10_SCAGO|nr:hypothetical protein [Scandinavium goeteborgense]TDN48072.1 hypothetical protein EC847_12823 [Scandinavium goeteborgense]
MKIKMGLFICLISLSMQHAYAGTNYVDPIQKKIDEQHMKLIPGYKKTCKSNNTMSCNFEAAERAEDTVPNRGSRKYIKATYGAYSKAQAKSKLKELVALYDRIDGQSKSTWTGKVTTIQIESEIRWLMNKKLEQYAPDITSARLYLGMPVH